MRGCWRNNGLLLREDGIMCMVVDGCWRHRLRHVVSHGIRLLRIGKVVARRSERWTAWRSHGVSMAVVRIAHGPHTSHSAGVHLELLHTGIWHH